MSHTLEFDNFEYNGKIYSGVVSYEVEWSSDSTDSSGYFTSDDDDDECAIVESYSLEELYEVKKKKQIEIEPSESVFKEVEEAISHLVDNHCDSLELERGNDDSEYESDEDTSEEE